MQLIEITSLVMSSISTANTIDSADCAQHLAGFRACIGSVIIEISPHVSTDGGISEDGVWKIENLCLRTLDVLSKEVEGLVPFIDGIKDATLCLKSIIQKHKDDIDASHP